MRIENPQPPGKGERDSGPPPRVFFFASWLLKSLHEAYMKYYVKALLSSSLCRVFFFASWLLKILHEALREGVAIFFFMSKQIKVVTDLNIDYVCVFWDVSVDDDCAIG